MKFLINSLVFLTTLAVFVIAGAAYWAFDQFQKPGPLENTITVNIPHGSSVYGISEILVDKGVISRQAFTPVNIFVYGSKITEQSSRLKAGEYEFPPHLSIAQILDKLEEGKVIQRQITIREGLTNWEIEQFLMNEGVLDKEEEVLPLPEGSYLPETYSYQNGDSVAGFMQRMNQSMENVILPLCGILLEREASASFAVFLPQDCPNAKAPLKTVGDVLTLASIIEKETAVPSERKRVAGVFFNRLRMNMALQTDPTVIYAITKGEHQNNGKGPLGRRLLKKDLEFDSPYNTYLYPGLPPGAICNPGKASIQAALNPEEHKYIYFVADGSGGHAFATTLAGHNANVAKWRKIRKGQ
ncbi:MAG: endolytic transglycosylase MltG [Alcanivorax sp.]